MPFFREHPEALAQFRQGHRNTLEAVYWAYVERVRRLVRLGFAYTRTGVFVRGAVAADIDDLVQEVFARAFSESARTSFDGLSDYGPFLLTIARNLLSDWARKQGREIAAHQLDSLAAEPAEDSGPWWGDAEVVAVVEAYLATLTDDLRAVHEQRYVRNRSQAATASALGLTRQRVRTLEGKLRKGLARALKKAGHGRSA
jgi:RNA polymerase sigma factor (sigma-70 family)